jgi:hypothetical protein
MDEAHAWAEQRLLPRVLTTLNEADEARFDQHARNCVHCRQRLAELTAEAGGDLAARGHLPAAMIARWPLAGTRLAGLEREAVQLHLERCELCRDELRLLGHTAELGAAAAPAAAVRAASAPTPTGPATRRAAAPPRPWRAWWTGGAVGALATAALLLLMLRPAPSNRQEFGADGAPPLAGTVNPTPGEGPTLVAVPWTAPAALRGAEVQLQVPAGTRELAVAVAVPPAADAEATHRVTLWGPDLGMLARIAVPAEQIVAGTAFVLLRGSEPLVAGTYRVVVHAGPGAGDANDADGAASANRPGGSDPDGTAVVGGAPADSSETFFELAVIQ